MHITTRCFLALYGFFLVFTISVQILNLSGAHFGFLYLAGVLALVAGAAMASFAPALEGECSSSRWRLPEIRLQLGEIRRIPPLGLSALAVLCLTAPLCAYLQYTGWSFIPIWACCILVALFSIYISNMPDVAPSLVVVRSEQSDDETSHTDKFFLGLTVLVILFYFGTSTPDGDDSLFLNIASGAKRAREHLMQFDTMLGVPDLEFIKSTYKIESYIILSSFLSDILGIETILAAHAITPVLAIVFAMSVYTLLLSALFGQSWPVAFVSLFIFFLVISGHFYSYGAFGFTRFFHGKSLLVSVMVPLIGAMTIAAVTRGKPLWYGLLSGAVIIAIGFTANAIYVAPLVVGLVASPFFLAGDRSARIATLWLGSALVYPALLASYLLIFDPPSPSQFQTAGNISTIFWNVLGAPYAHLLFLAALFAGALAALLNPRFRAISIVTLVFLVCVLNPFLWDYYGEFVTGNVNFRLLWVLPAPFLLSLLFGVLWISCKSAIIRVGLIIGLLACCFLPSALYFQPGRFDWKWSLINVHVPEYAIARRVVDLTPPGELLLAPEELALWIATFDAFRPIVEARRIYTPQRAHILGDPEYSQRKQLFEWINGKRDNPGIEKMLDDLGVGVVVAKSERARNRKLLEAMPGFRWFSSVDGYEVYIRRDVEQGNRIWR